MATETTHPSAATSLDRGQPQHVRVSHPFFDLLGISAPLVSDGLLLPWQTDGSRGTVWIMAHDRAEAFDLEDTRMMQVVSDFVGMAHRHGSQHRAHHRFCPPSKLADRGNPLT